ncbi:MAG: hypothetical protein GYA17_16980 [Chloroflexi bacterium]|nr:hypothetical protein [Anaerolineaceae bacterium]NMB90054.1 hypothetical protein [Chloroflexota bacterium]
MVTRDERLKIMELVAEGKITAEEAVDLLGAIEEGGEAATPTRPAGSDSRAPGGKEGRWMRIRVTDVATGKSRANVRLPLRLVRAGINLGMRFAPQEMAGIDADAIEELIRSGEGGQIIDVVDDEDGEHVEIFVE